MAGYFLMICTRGDMRKIPRCEVPGCCAPAQFTHYHYSKSDITKRERKYRKSSWVREIHGAKNGWVCATHHFSFLAERKGQTKKEFMFNIKLKTARKNGFKSIQEYINSLHPYRKYRKDYCENIDGRLGFKCTTTTPPQELIEKVIDSGYYEGHLQVDHIDGVPSNNDPDNLQTLCACCHNFKTAMNKDYLSPGRKGLGLNSNGTFSMVKTA